MLNRKIEIAVALVFATLILFGFYLTSQIDLAFSIDLEQVSGPRAYPGIIFASMLFFNVLLLAQQCLKLRKRRSEAGGAAASDEPLFAPAAIKVVWVLLALIVFVLTYERLGYLLTMLPLMLVVAKMNGAEKNTTAVLVCAALYILCLVVFRYGLDTVLPEGLLGIDMVL